MKPEEILDRIIAETELLKETTSEISLGSYPSDIIFSGKIVYKDSETGKIIRVEKTPGYVLRKVLVEQANTFGVASIFEEEILIINKGLYTKTSQRELLPWDDKYDDKHLERPSRLLFGETKEFCALSKRLYQDYPEIYSSICDFFELFQIQFIPGNNAGVDPETNKLKIFDWFGNYWVDTQGGIICSRLQ